MRLIQAVINDDADIYCMGDDHEGARAQYEKGLDATIKEIEKNNNASVIHHGDALETLTIDNPYYEPSSLKVTQETQNPSVPLEQVHICSERYRPICGKIACWLTGNHERRARRWGDLAAEILRDLDCKDVYGGYLAKVSFVNASNRLIYKQLCFHGRRVADTKAASEKQKQANREAQLMRTLAPLAGDCLVMSMGHTHRLIVSNPVDRLYLYDDGKSLKQGYIKSGQQQQYIDPENRIYVNTGSFLRSQMIGIDTYSEIAGYPPAQLGYAVVHIRKGKISEVEARTI